MGNNILPEVELMARCSFYTIIRALPRKFWCRGYYVNTVGRNEKKITEYIRNQLVEDKLADQLTLKELIDPFTGESVKEGK